MLSSTLSLLFCFPTILILDTGGSDDDDFDDENDCFNGDDGDNNNDDDDVDGRSCKTNNCNLSTRIINNCCAINELAKCKL